MDAKNWKVATLKEELSKRGLLTTGNKPDLMARLLSDVIADGAVNQEPASDPPGAIRIPEPHEYLAQIVELERLRVELIKSGNHHGRAVMALLLIFFLILLYILKGGAGACAPINLLN